MKIRSLAALLMAAILLLGGCTPPMGPDDGTIPPVSDTVGESGTDTAADTSPDTETPTEAPTSAPTEAPTETEAPRGGCGSAVATSILLPALVAVGTACVSRKRRKTEE